MGAESGPGEEDTGMSTPVDMGKGYADKASQWVSEVGAENATDAKFNNMEVAAESGGPEAEARRTEMGKWSEATGRVEESKARYASKAASELVQDGATAEETRDTLTKVAHNEATVGVAFQHDQGNGTEKTTFDKATDRGVLSDGVELRSPTTLAMDAEDSQREAA